MKVADERIQKNLNYLLKNQCVHFMRERFFNKSILKESQGERADSMSLESV